MKMISKKDISKKEAINLFIENKLLGLELFITGTEIQPKEVLNRDDLVQLASMNSERNDRNRLRFGCASNLLLIAHKQNLITEEEFCEALYCLLTYDFYICSSRFKKRLEESRYEDVDYQ